MHGIAGDTAKLLGAVIVCLCGRCWLLAWPLSACHLGWVTLGDTVPMSSLDRSKPIINIFSWS